MNDNPHSPGRGWPEKFRDAFRGVKVGVRGQSSFFVHLFFVAAVIGAGVVLQVTQTEWCLLALSMAVVLAAEMFNTAIESMARAITKETHPDLGDALDIGSAAVLLAAGGAVVVGLIVFGNRLLGWWAGG
jgi:diacylglycerol kinase (ATP)